MKNHTKIIIYHGWLIENGLLQLQPTWIFGILSGAHTKDVWIFHFRNIKFDQLRRTGKSDRITRGPLVHLNFSMSNES